MRDTELAVARILAAALEQIADKMDALMQRRPETTPQEIIGALRESASGYREDVNIEAKWGKAPKEIDG